MKDEKDQLLSPDEISSLNIEDMDVEELEQRLEMSLADPLAAAGIWCDTNCGSYSVSSEPAPTDGPGES